jgi:acyl-CoA reductase-like NAD-dependent aldehyde dehydrogenase
MSAYQSINPSSEELIAEYPSCSREQADLILENLWRAFSDWKKNSLPARLEHVAAFKKIVKQREAELALCITSEMGKTLRDAKGEGGPCSRIVILHWKKHLAFLKKGNCARGFTCKVRVSSCFGKKVRSALPT